MRRDVFQAIADPVRRDILELISNKELTVNDIARHFEISRQAISKQLIILTECGLLNRQKSGRARFYSINPQGLVPAYLWMEQLQKHWEDKIDSFEHYVNQLKKKQNDQ